MEQIERNLLEGERILWAGKSAPFKIMEKPYDKILKITWGICIFLFLLATVGYLPFGLSGKDNLSVSTTLICWAVMVSIPAFIAIRPILDKRILERKTFYAITNYRVMVASDQVLRTISYDQDTPIKVDMVTENTGTISVGAACKATTWYGRRQALAGVRDEEDSLRRPYIGLTFYNVEDPEAVCRYFRKPEPVETEMDLPKAV